MITVPRSALLTLASQPPQFFCSPQSTIHWSCCYWKNGFASWWMLNQKIQPSQRAEKEELLLLLSRPQITVIPWVSPPSTGSGRACASVCMCVQHVSVQDPICLHYHFSLPLNLLIFSFLSKLKFHSYSLELLPAHSLNSLTSWWLILFGKVTTLVRSLCELGPCICIAEWLVSFSILYHPWVQNCCCSVPNLFTLPFSWGRFLSHLSSFQILNTSSSILNLFFSSQPFGLFSPSFLPSSIWRPRHAYLFPICSPSLLIWFSLKALDTSCLFVISECISPAQTSLLNSRLVYPVVVLTSLFYVKFRVSHPWLCWLFGQDSSLW